MLVGKQFYFFQRSRSNELMDFIIKKYVRANEDYDEEEESISFQKFNRFLIGVKFTVMKIKTSKSIIFNGVEN